MLPTFKYECEKSNVNFDFCIPGKLWLNDPEINWRQEMHLPSSEESKIALQTRLGLSPSELNKSICTNIKEKCKKENS